jgi:hypothetical protein
VSRTHTATAPSPLRQLWHKWRFHLNILLLLIPLGFMPKYFADAALFRGESGLAELRNQAPQLNGPAGYMKSFNAALCDTCVSQVKATYLRIGKPRSLRAAGAIFFGTPYRMGAAVSIPKRLPADNDLWITMEGWDGSMHQASIPLSKASPATVAWLETQGRKP